MKNAGYFCDKCIYIRLRLPGVVIHLEHNSESAHVMETLYNQIYEYTAILTVIGNAIYS